MFSLAANLAALFFIFASQCAAHKPNILLIVVDDLGWSDVGYQNITKLQTPNIDQLATEGVILENYYVQPVCTPTRAALLTGRYPIHTGMQSGVVKPREPYGLPLEYTLLPHKLKEAGYSTHMVGKWHLGYYMWEYTPTYRGFDTFYGFYNDDQDHWTHEREGILDFRDQTEPVLDARNQYSANLFAERAKQVIEAQNTSKPMFLYLPFLNVHEPVQAPARFVDMYKDIKNDTRRVHAGMVSAVDEAIGNVTATLKNKGLWNNTLIIFSTDNGGVPIFGGYNWPLRGSKLSLWEGGVRGVGFVHGKMIQNKGRRCRELLHVTDWYPTILGLAGMLDVSSITPPLDGINIWDTISEGAPSPREEILHNINTPDEQPDWLPWSFIPPGEGIALRSGHMKLMMEVLDFPWFQPPELGGAIVWSNKSLNSSVGRIAVALYNITADPEERHDLSTKYPDVVAKLRKRVDYYWDSTKPSVKKPADPLAYETAKKKGYWGPWRSSNRSNSKVINICVIVLSVLIVSFI